MPLNPPAPIEAIDRALLVLEALAKSGPQGTSLNDLAAAVGANKSTIYRAAHTLKIRGFAVQDPVTGQYSLGSKAFSLGQHFLQSDRLRTDLHPALMTLSRETGELIHLGVLSGDSVLYIDKVEAEHAISVRSRVGRSEYAYQTALGRAILAARNYGPDAIAAYIPPEVAADPGKVDHVTSEVQRAREQGYSREIQENETGVACVGAPIFYEKQAVAAISVTGPINRMTETKLDDLGHTLIVTLTHALPPGYTAALG